MRKEYIMGNGAIALGALSAGINVVSGYPGTPSSEIIETIADYHQGKVHVEWSVNEKAALEVAAGAAYTGARTLVTMKQVGLNVAFRSSDVTGLHRCGRRYGHRRCRRSRAYLFSDRTGHPYVCRILPDSCIRSLITGRRI